ncbi:PhoD-like phosphatase-domain-containing protein [Catenaria anguillulae PL171]|uniref:PhoD-like phosphatase-domain-containing protein n=1 Tax=Catenaria anguillulae PL171 TaxID=765915 RepID=A0A1Y2HNL5_9FUNG|nr:PhoD-like phosphatase-domain-containing protein [Catenaria anguillulae PL171]
MKLLPSFVAAILSVTALVAAVAADSGAAAGKIKLARVETSVESLANNYENNLVFKSPFPNMPSLAVKVSTDKLRKSLESSLLEKRDVGTVSFRHGVASGDPLHDRVILWTKITASRPGATVPVEYQVATDAQFTNIVRTAAVVTSTEVDYTVKVDATGLQPSTSYFYRFIAAGTTSPVGQTRTFAPAGANLDQLKMAVFSCSNMPHGYFHAYRRVAERRDIDLTLHLGDYIYEYDKAGYKPVGGEMPAERDPQPPKVISTLADYRGRHAQYKGDADLQALHASKPMIVVWDDHETVNDANRDGSKDHKPDRDGDYKTRKLNAARAYHEYQPLRPVSADNQLKIYRQFKIGNWLTCPCSTRASTRATRKAMASATWKVLGNQVMIAPLPSKVLAWEIDFLADSWSGYPYSRNRLLSHIRNNKISNVVALTGDLHASIAWTSLTAITTKPLVAVDFSSNLWGRRSHRQGPPRIKHILYRHGYMAVTFTKQKVRTEYVFINSVKTTGGVGRMDAV